MLRRRVGGSPRSPQIPAVRCVDRQNPAICGVLFLWGSLSIQLEEVRLSAFEYRAKSPPSGAVFDADAQDGISSIAVNKTAAQVSDPEAWINESAEFAKQFAYAPPVSTGTNAIYLTREYETKARNIARSQAALAAARLANLINNALR